MFLARTVAEDLEYESEQADVVNEHFTNFPNKNFVTELNETALKNNENEELNKNKSGMALNLNKNMQEKLLEIRQELESMLKKCKDKYHKNEIFLNELLAKSVQQTKLYSRHTFNYCGMPYFKDTNGFFAPPNSDYLHRSNDLKEFFPADLIKKSAVWTLKDLTSILFEIKDQVTDFLQEKAKITEYSLKNTRSRDSRISQTNSKYATMTLKDLINCSVNENFQINWYLVNAALENRHSETCCEAMWNLYLHPDLKRSSWTEDEDKLLGQIAEKYNYQNWLKISEELGQRSEFQCFVRYSTMLIQSNKKTQKWTKEEDSLLLHAVECSRMNNKICWNLVQQYLPQRDKKSLITRYSYSLDPNIVKGNFTPEEDCILLGAVEEYGENFSLIPLSLFPGRTSVQIRNRYWNTLKYVNKHQHWSTEDDKKLMDWVKVNGTNKWSELAKTFGYHNRCSVRQRYGTITKFLNKNPNADLAAIPRKHRKQRTNITKDNWVENFKELSKNPSKNESKSNQFEYINRLRALEKDYYHFFKYSYDLKLNNEASTIFPPIKNIHFLCNVFNVQVNDKVFLPLRKSKFTRNELKFLQQVVSKCSDPTSNSDPYVLCPPNWSTLLGMRAICIQCASTAEVVPVSKNNTEMSIVGQNAKEKFKKVFRSLFYKTMLLTRLKNVAADSKNQEINIEVTLESPTVSEIKNITVNIGKTNNITETITSSSQINVVTEQIKINEESKNIAYVGIYQQNNKKHCLNERDNDVDVEHKNKILKIEHS